MGLMEIELARLDYRERVDEAARANAEHRRRAEHRSESTPELLPVPARREAKIDSPVLSIRLGGFRYRLWFTRSVAV